MLLALKIAQILIPRSIQVPFPCTKILQKSQHG